MILSNHLVAAGFTSFSVLAAANPRDIEIACSKTPPFGNSVRNFALNMPRYRSTVQYTIYIYIIFTLQYTYIFSLFYSIHSIHIHVHCTLFNDQIHLCIYNPYFTLYVHCTLYITVCSHTTLSLRCTLYSVHSFWYIMSVFLFVN